MAEQPPESHRRTAEKYYNIMEEIRTRLHAIEIALTDEFKDRLPVSMASDFCALQFRKVFEAIAVGCLVAHGETKGKINKVYQADKLIKALSLLAPECYPAPVMAKGGNPVSIATVIGGDFLKREQLIRYYQQLHPYLHVGSLMKRKERAQQIAVESFKEMLRLTHSLLSTHVMLLKEEEFSMLVILGQTAEPESLTRIRLFGNL